MTEPTDAELLEVIREAARGGAIRRDGSTSLRIARAVLAKWGTPAPVGVEPVAETLADHESGETGYCDFSKALPNGTKLYTTPRPTQPQAGAVPLSPFIPAQRERLYYNRPENVGKGASLADWHRIVQFIEAAHGIGETP